MVYAQAMPGGGTAGAGGFASTAHGYRAPLAYAPYPGHLPPVAPRDRTLEWLIPVGRTGLSIAAGYAGIVALFIFYLAPGALVLGVLALRGLRDSPLGGRGRAWFAVIAGSLGSALLALFIVTNGFHLVLPSGPDRITAAPGQSAASAAPSSSVTPGTVLPDPGPPVFIDQDRPLPYMGHLAVEGGHGTGSARGPAFSLPAGPTGRVGVIIGQPEGPTSVFLVSAARPQTKVLLGTCATSCTDQVFTSPARLKPGRYQVVIDSPSRTQWNFVVFIQ